MKKIVSVLCCFALLFGFAACDSSPAQGHTEYDADTDGKIAEEILSAEKNKVIFPNGEDESFRIRSVKESEDSVRTANKKFELDIAADVTGNVYDPEEVDVYGQFVSPSGELYTMPAFWFSDYERSFDPLDESAEYPMNGYVEQGDVRIVGVIDEVNGVKKPVAKAKFGSASGSYSNAGAILSVGDVSRLHDGVSVWLRKDASLEAETLYLGFYQSAGEAYIELPELTEEWKEYTFEWEDFTANNTDGSSELLSIGTMYSGYVQTRGAAVSGNVYISDLRAVRVGFENSVVLSDFVSSELANYKAGELNGTEVMTPLNESWFKLRFRFDETGEWTYRIVAEKEGEVKAEYVSSVTAEANPNEEENRGLIRVEPTQKRNFIFEDGTPYVPIGQNVAYTVDPQRGSYDYEVYFPKMAAAGMNFCRVWLTYIGYGVQSTEGGILDFDYRQDKAYAFDCIIELAAQYGLYLQIPLMTFSRFHEESATDDVEHRSWDSSPFNVNNGGYLEKPEEFWSDARAREDTKKLYRYYVARWGYSRNILNWEIMNEIGESSSYDQQRAKAWAEDIGGYMHSVDPYDHLVSLSSKDFYDEVYSASSLDFVSIHSYVWGSAYPSSSADITSGVRDYFGKPVMIGEIGASGNSAEEDALIDPDGYVMRQTAFTAPMSGAAGGAMLWWWLHINDDDLYGNVTPAANYFSLLPDDFVTMDSMEGQDYVITAQNAAIANQIRALGFVSGDAVYAYLYDIRYSYAQPDPGELAGVSAAFNGLSDGSYTVRVFDTRTGEVISTNTASASGGTLTVALAAWHGDVALLIEKA